MGGKTISNSDTKIEALSLQSSAYGVTIPIVGGVTRIAGNLIYQTDFKAVPNTSTQGGKGGAKVQTTSFTYTTALLMGLCAGQINGVQTIWVGKKKYANDAGALVVTQAIQSATVPPGGSVTVTSAANYTANVSVLCSTGSGEDASTTQLAEGIDYTVQAGVYAFSSAWIGALVSITYQYTTAGSGSTALSKLGITLVPGALSQTSLIPSWLSSRHPSDALPYAGIAYVAADAYSLGTGAQVDNHNFEVVAAGAYSLGSTTPDIDPSAFAVKVLQDTRYGARLPSSYFDVSGPWSAYCLANNLLMSPAITTQMKAADFFAQMAQLTNTGIVWSGGKLKMIPYGDATATGNGATYTPNLTPVYDLSDDAFLVQPGEAPVRAQRKKQSDAYNHIQVQYRNRANDYAPDVAEAKDQADIDTNGLRSAAIVNAEWICDTTVARNVAQLLLQRSVYVRSTYEFSLPWNFAFLEPMDLVTLTDAGLGLSKTPVRITDVSEADGQLDFTAEEFPLGVANAATYSTQVSAGYWTDYNAAPGSVAAPVFFEAPLALTTSGLEVYVAATSANPKWGGCRVWASMDGTNYREVGRLQGGSRYGQLTAAVGSTAAVSLVSGQLLSGSAADATGLTTLCYVGGATPEYFAFQTATLTGTLAYSLGGLVRGAYATPAGNAHAAGDPFVRVDNGVASSGPLDLSMIGKTIYFKFTSFNIFGLNEEALSAVTQYSYAITGYMTMLAPTSPTGVGVSFEASGARLFCNKNPEVTVVGYEWRIGNSSSTWATAAVLDKLGGTSSLWSTASAGSYNVFVAAVDSLGNVSTPTLYVLTVTSANLGANAPAISLLSTGDFFTFADPSTATSSSPAVTLTTNLSNLTGTVTWTATAYNASNTSLGVITIGTSGNTATVSTAQFNSAGATTTRYVVVQATLGGVTVTKTLYRNDGGASALMFGYAYLYQWSPTTPSNPGTTATSTYNWTTGASSGYTGSGGWSTTAPANPGTPGVQLWQAVHQVSAASGTTSSTVTWSAGSYTVTSVGANGATGSTGASGTQAVVVQVYQWAATIPAGPSGTATYTWSSGAISSIPTGWASSPGTSPSAGFTLWAARVNLVDTASVSSSVINWTTAAVVAVGYAGSNGGTGQQGASSRMCYSRIAGNPSPTSNTLAMAGDTLPSASASNLQWGLNVTWTATDPSPSSTNTLYQADGVFNPATNQTVWSTPYISSLKVGSLSSITSNTGSLVVSGSIQSGTALQSGTTMTGAGLIVGNSGQFSVGNATTNITFNGSVMTLNGNVVGTGNLNPGAVTQSYAASSTTGAVSVAITVPSGATSLVVLGYVGDPYITTSSTGEAGSGALIVPQGQLWVNGVNVTIQQGSIVWSTGSPTAGSYNVTINRNAGSTNGTMYLSVLVGKR